MLRVLLSMILLTLLTPSILSGADTLSVVPLAKALQNPDLTDLGEDGNTARETVRAELWNHPREDKPSDAPVPETEAELFRHRLAQIARHRQTRVGKLFFAALEHTPGVTNLAESMTRATMITRWPLALQSYLQVRVEYSKRGTEWRVATLELTVHGVAAAPISGLAPYFGPGEGDPAVLDFEPIDYLVGRDPLDRQRPEDEQSDFDFDAALKEIFETSDDYTTMLQHLDEKITPTTDDEDCIAALMPYLTSETYVTPEQRKPDENGNKKDPGPVQAELMKAADEAGRGFWRGIEAQIDNALKAPRPDAVPADAGGSVELEYTDAAGDSHLLIVRMENGRVSPREGRLRQAMDTGESDG